ncbi:MAG TPA: ParB/RepB/Spo0J family partition protein [Mycobacteriales bacterium]|nr:ParB/RepB/Spo0J family partition protein [Mycobacteriales bacterium]
MNVRKGGLGRGLGALISASPAGDPDAGAYFADLPVESIEANPWQPRDVFDEEAMAELVASIREVGVLQPVVVRELDGDRFQLVMGERRLRASREAGQATIPAIVRQTGDDVMLRDALLENLHRQQLNPLEEAAAYSQLLEEFGATHEELAARIGRSRPQISNTIRLLALPPTVQRRVAAGVLSAGHARALLALPDADAQERLAARIVAEGMSVRATEEAVTSGLVETKVRARRRKPLASPALERLSEQLSDLLETRVTIELGRQRGKLTVQFASMGDLQRVLQVLAPEVVAGQPLTADED